MKVCVLTNILAPYRMGLFESLAGKVDELTVLLMAGSHDNRSWELPDPAFATTVLTGLHLKVPGFEEPFHFNTGVTRTLRRIDPDVVISGGFTAANVAAYLYCRRYGKLYLSWGELTLLDGADRSWIRRVLRRWLISGGDGVIASSTVARKAFEHYGAAADRTLLSVMPIDVDGYATQAAAFRDSREYHALKARLPGPCLISIGRLIDLKGYSELFEIYRKLLEHHPQASLLVAGEGAQRTRYEAIVAAAGWQRVHFLGFLQARELIEYLCVADVFVFHTRYDPFGAVLSEAMACRTPVVTSVHAAATHDLVRNGTSGYVIDPAATGPAVAAIRMALEMTGAQRLAMVDAAYESVKAWDFAAASSAIVELLQRLLDGSDVRVPRQRAQLETTAAQPVRQPILDRPLEHHDGGQPVVEQRQAAQQVLRQ